MMENVLTMVALLGLGCVIVGAVCIALAAIWSAGNE
jgi:hypothetical protein